MPESVNQVHKKPALKYQNPIEADRIRNLFNLHPITARVIAARGFKADADLKHYLSPTLKEGLPHPEKLKNIDLASTLIAKAAGDRKRIAICSDYDVDGLTGNAQLTDFLNSAGVSVLSLVPDRFQDGYGLNTRMVEAAAAEGAALLICIDFGTTNISELLLAKRLGMKTIVIDHHHVGEQDPPADVFVNHHQDGCGFANEMLCASGLVWYLIALLRKKIPEADRIDPRSYLDLASLGTICDMVPLLGANRVIAKRGLEALSTTKRPGLLALKEVMGAGDKINCYNVSFGFGPRINAAGRILNAELALELLTTKNTKRAKTLAAKLEKLNLKRREIEANIKAKAIDLIKKKDRIPPAIVVSDNGFHTGVIGIVAQRLTESFYRPAAVMGMDADGIFKGSVRGIPGFSVIEALTKCSHLLERFGGHTGAGGFSIVSENLDSFAERFCEVSEELLNGINKTPVAAADAEIQLSDLSFELVKELKNMAPFGVGNPGPRLLVRNLKVSNIKVLKGEHIKASLTDGKAFLPALLWRTKSHPALAAESRVNLVFKPEINTFNGTSQVQANIEAVDQAG